MRSPSLYSLQAGLSNIPGKVVRFPPQVKEYLKGRFTVGKVTGNKFDPFPVAADMRVARDEQEAGSFAQEIALANKKLHQCAQRSDSENEHSAVTAMMRIVILQR